MLRFFWEVERIQALVNKKQPKTAAFRKQAEYCGQVLSITDEMRDIVIDKWLTYAKNDHLNEI